MLNLGPIISINIIMAIQTTGSYQISGQHLSESNYLRTLPWSKKNTQILEVYLQDWQTVKQSKFEQLVTKGNSKTIFNILFSQNLFMQSIFQLILKNKKIMGLISSWAATKSLQINQVIQQDIKQSRRFFKITKDINKKIFQIFYQDGEFSFDFNQFLHLCLIKVVDQQDFILILSRYSLQKRVILMKKYINLAIILKFNQPLLAFLQKIYDYYFKNQIWTNGKFNNYLNDCLTNPQLMVLSQLKHNIVHQFVIKEDLYSIRELLSKSERQTVQNSSVILSLFCQYNINNVTPVSHALKYWSYNNLKVLLCVVIKNNEKIKLNTECILDLLKNQRIMQNELEQLLSQILSNHKSKGFKKLIKRISLRKYQAFVSNKYDVVDVYDIQELKIVPNKTNGCAVINYMNRYQQKSNLKIILSLQPNKFKKKSIKSIYKITRKLTPQKQYIRSLMQTFQYFQEFKMSCLKYTLLKKQAGSRRSDFTQFDDQIQPQGPLFSFLYQNTFRYKQFWSSYFSKNSVCYHLEAFRIDDQLEKQIIKFVSSNLHKFQEFLFQVKYLQQNYHIVRKIQDKVKEQFLRNRKYLNYINFYRCLKAIKYNKQTCIISYNQFNNFINEADQNIFKWQYDIKYPFNSSIFDQLSRNIVLGKQTDITRILSKHFVIKQSKFTNNFFYQYIDQKTYPQYEIVIQVILIMANKKIQLNTAIFLVNLKGKSQKYQQFINKLIQCCSRIQADHQSLKEIQISFYQKLLKRFFTPPNSMTNFLQNFLSTTNIFYNKIQDKKNYQNIFISIYKALRNILKESMRDPSKLFNKKIQQHFSNKQIAQIQQLKVIMRKMHILYQQRILKQYSLNDLKVNIQENQEQNKSNIFEYLKEQKLKEDQIIHYFNFYLFYASLFNQIELQYIAKRQQKYYQLFYTIYMFRTQTKEKCIKFLEKSIINCQILNFIQWTNYQVIAPFFHENKYILKAYYLNQRKSEFKLFIKYIIQSIIKKYENQQIWPLLLKIKKYYSFQLQYVFNKLNRIKRMNNKQSTNILSASQKTRQNHFKVVQIIFVNSYCNLSPYNQQSKILSYRQMIERSQTILQIPLSKTQHIYFMRWRQQYQKYIGSIKSMMQNDEQFSLFLKIMKKLDKDLMLSQQIYQKCYSQFKQLSFSQFNIKLESSGYQQYYFIQYCLLYAIIVLKNDQKWSFIQLILENNKIARKRFIPKIIFLIRWPTYYCIKDIQKIRLTDRCYLNLINFLFENCDYFDELCEQNIYQNNIYSILLKLHPYSIYKFFQYIQYNDEYKMPEPALILRTINLLPQHAAYFLQLPNLVEKKMIKYYEINKQKDRMRRSSGKIMSQKVQPLNIEDEIAYKYVRVKYSTTNKKIIQNNILHVNDQVVAQLYFKIFKATKSRTSLHLLINVLITQNWHIDLVRENLTPSQMSEVVTILILQNPQKFDTKKWGINNLFRQLTDQILHNRFQKYHVVSFNFFKLMIENNCFDGINRQQNRLKYETFHRIFKTHQKEKIQIYMNKYSIKFDQALRRNLSIYCVDITQGIINLNERKMIQIIKKYRLIDYFCDFLASQKLLLAICKQQMFQLLNFYIEHLKAVYANIEFVSSTSQQCGLRHNILRLPLQASKYYGFYAYHYLIKSFRQKLPLLSTRSKIFRKFNLNLYSTAKIQYIRQMIVDEAKKFYQQQQSVIPQFQFIITKKIVIFQQLLCNQYSTVTKIYLAFKYLFEEQILSTNIKFNKAITSLVNTVSIAINNEHLIRIGRFEMVYILYINKKKHQIPQQVLKQRYSKQLKIIQELLFVIGFNLWQFQHLELSKQLFNSYLQLKQQLLIYNPYLFIEYFHEELRMSQAQCNQLQILLSLKRDQFKQFSNEVYETIDIKNFHVQVDYFVGICANLTFLSESYSQIYSSYCFKLTKLLQFYESTQNINKYNIMINMILLLFIIKAEFDQSKISNDLCIEHLLYLYEDRLRSIDQILYYFISQINSPNTNLYLVHDLIQKLLVIQNIKTIKKDLRYQYLSVKEHGIKPEFIKSIIKNCVHSFIIPQQIIIGNINEIFAILFSKEQLKVSPPLIQMIIAINLKIISNQLIIISNYLLTDSNQMRSQNLNIKKIRKLKQMIRVEKLQFIFVHKQNKNPSTTRIQAERNLKIFLNYEIVGERERFYFITFCQKSIEDLKQLISKLFIESQMKKSQKYLQQQIEIKQQIFNNLLWSHSYKFDLESLYSYKSYKVMNQMLKRTVIENKIVQIVANYDENYNEELNINHQSRLQHFKDNFNYYSVDDLFGPLSQIHEPNQIQFQHVLSFYKLIPFPQSQKNIIIKFIHEQQFKNLKKIDVQVLQKYCKYAYNKYMEKSFQDIIQNTIYFIINDQNEVRIMMQYCSSSILINILKFIRIKEKLLIFSLDIYYKFSINSIKVLLKKIQQYIKCEQSFKDLLDELINSNTVNLLNELILLNSNHITFLSSIKYCIFNFIINSQPKDNMYIISKILSITHIQYEKSNTSLLINIYLNIGYHNKSQQLNKYYLPINRKDYLKKITTIEQLTNYFIKKNDLQLYCYQISTQLSNQVQTPLNIYINYQQLYDFAKQKFEQNSIQQMQELFLYLYDYITLQLKYEIQYYTKTVRVQERYQNLTYCVFQSIIMQKPLDQLLNKNELDLQFFLLNKIIQAIPRMQFNQSDKCNLQRNKILNNSFLLQIKKHSIKEITTKAEFLCQFKEKGFYSYLKIENIEQYSKFALHNIDYIFLIAKQFPEDSQFSHQNILSIFYSDNNRQIYKIYQQKKLLLSINNDTFKHSISQNRLLNMNICLYLQFTNKQQSKKNQETFIINLSQLFQKRKISIQNIKGDNLNALNKFIQSEKNMEMLNQIQKNYFQKMENKLNFKLFIQNNASSKLQKITELSLQSTLQFLSLYFQRCLINDQYKLVKSIQKQYCMFTQNPIEQKRKIFFITNILSVQMKITGSQQYIVSYNQQLKIVNISIGSEIEYIEFGYQFVRKILFTLLAISKINHQCLSYKYTDNQLTNLDILCAVDYNLVMFDQIKELLIAVKLIKYAFNVQLIYSIQLVCNNQMTKAQYRQEQQRISLTFNVSSHIRTVFTANYLVQRFLGSYYQNIFIQYNHEKREITCENIYEKQNSVQLFTFSENRIISQKVKINHQALPKITIPYGTKILEKTRFFIIFPLNKICAYNYLFTINRNIKENNIIDKGRNKLYPNKVYKFLLRQKQENTIENLICARAQKQNKKYFNAIKQISSRSRTDLNLPQLMKIKKLTKNINIVQLQYPKYQLISFKINHPSLVNIINPQVTSTIIQFSGKRQMQALNLNFVLFTKIKFDKRETIIQNNYYVEKRAKSNQLEKYLLQDNQLVSYSEFTSSHAKKQSFYYRIHNEDLIYSSRAGQERIDYIQFANQQGSVLEVNMELKIKAVFVHSFSLVQVQAKVQFDKNQIGLLWAPTLRGSYLLFINNWCIKKNHQIGILANIIDISRLQIVIPQQKVLNYNQDYKIKIRLRDSFNNQFSELQSKLFHQQIKDISIVIAKKQLLGNFIFKINKVDENGILQMLFKLSFLPSNEQVEYYLIYKDLKITTFKYSYKGLNLQYRKQNLQKQISRLKIYQQVLIIQRNNFLQDIVRIAQTTKLNACLRINFKNEPGIDAGGLKRQFYDMIGKQMKKQKNNFFQTFNSQKGNFFFHSKLLKKKKKESFMSIWGIYLANSIINGYLTGINFAQPFIKLLYDQPITYEDLLQISSQTQIESYESLFKYSDQDLQSVCLSFCEYIDGQNYQLKEDGANIPVTKENLQQYLNLKANYIIKIRYKQVVQAFISGFNLIFDLEIIKKHIQSCEFWCLTMGRKQITPQVLIDSINFTGYKIDQILSWFKKYIYESKSQLLIGFLKFTTSSSCLQFNMGQQINVHFESKKQANPLLGIPKGAILNEGLPVSHTCFKKIEVPRYKSYQMLKQKFDYSFTECAQGFGIA